MVTGERKGYGSKQARDLKKSIDATLTLYDQLARTMDPRSLSFLKAIMKQCFLIGQIVGSYETRSLMMLLTGKDD